MSLLVFRTKFFSSGQGFQSEGFVTLNLFLVRSPFQSLMEQVVWLFSFERPLISWSDGNVGLYYVMLPAQVNHSVETQTLASHSAIACRAEITDKFRV